MSPIYMYSKGNHFPKNTEGFCQPSQLQVAGFFCLYISVTHQKTCAPQENNQKLVKLMRQDVHQQCFIKCELTVYRWDVGKRNNYWRQCFAECHEVLDTHTHTHTLKTFWALGPFCEPWEEVRRHLAAKPQGAGREQGRQWQAFHSFIFHSLIPSPHRKYPHGTVPRSPRHSASF